MIKQIINEIFLSGVEYLCDDSSIVVPDDLSF